MTHHERHPRRNAVMPDRAGLELRVDPEPVRRTDPAGDGRPGMVFIWLAVIVVGIAVLVIVALASSATPRGAQTTDLAPSRDLSAMPGPSAGLPRAPHVVSPMTGSSETPSASAVAGDGGGAPRFRGLATWFCLSGSSACTAGYDQADLVAAIDTDLGFAKGDRIRVRFGDRSVVVTVVDICGCPGDRLVDLTSGAFRELANLDVGVIPVTVELAGPGATLPATDGAP